MSQAERWNDYLPALERALSALTEAVHATGLSPAWTQQQAARACSLLSEINTRWHAQHDPSAALRELRTLCWDSPLEPLMLVRANLELISSWTDEITGGEQQPKN